jgi:hypothetical protein
VGVSADIKPGTWPNTINTKSKGMLPGAICGEKDFEVTTIDPATVKIYRKGITDGVAPLRWSYADVATPYTGPVGGSHTLTSDGYRYLVLQFNSQTVVSTFGLTGRSGKTILLIIKGNLNAASGGAPIQGQEYILMVK